MESVLVHNKTKKGTIMNEGTRNQLEIKLKKMLDHLDQAEAKKLCAAAAG